MRLTRKWLMVIALVMSLAMATGGTLAYLTDRATRENVFTLGNVNIEIDEKYQPDSELYPGVAVSKEAGIENIHANQPAYVWMVVSVPNALKDYITLGWADAYKNAVITDGVASPHTGYTGYLVKYPNVLEPNTATGNILESVTLKANVDYRDKQYVAVTNGVATPIDVKDQKIIVDGYAIQTESFNTVDAAYDAYYAQWGGLYGGDNNNEPTPPAKVTLLDKEATMTNKDGDATILDVNNRIDTTGNNMGLDMGEVDMDVLYQFQPTMSDEEGAASEYADWHADFVVSSNKDIPAYGIGLAGYYDAWCSLINDKWVMLASDSAIDAGTEIRLVETMGTTVAYKELCQYGNDGIGFLCGAVALGGKTIDDKTVEALEEGTTLTVELRLYEATGKSSDSETGNYKSICSHTYTF